ncbi:MAG: site-2 protease family protein [Planctomycetota bacterium]
MLQAPPISPYDVHFRLFGWEVRVSWTFWLAAIAFGFVLVRSVQDSMRPNAPHLIVLLALWTIAMFLSILIHELGHTWMLRRYRVHSHIVLYHFGGLAIPTSGSGYGRVGTSLRPWQQFWVSAAGPLVELGSAVLLIVVIRALGRTPEGIWMLPQSIVQSVQSDTTPLASAPLRALVIFYIVPSFLWSLLNLIPVYPLDGGQMCRAVVEARQGDASVWIWISVAAGVAAAIYGLKFDQLFMTMLFAVLAYQSYRLLPHVR